METRDSNCCGQMPFKITKSKINTNHLHSGAGVRTKLEGAEYAIFRSKALTDLSGAMTSPPARGLIV